jgi:hypothetical protein
MNPFETFLLCMLLEEHKEVQRLRSEVETLHYKIYGDLPGDPSGAHRSS